MIVIDTNAISKMMRHEPDPQVRAWTNSVGRLHTTAISLAEINVGLARLPDGRRRDRLTAMADAVFAAFDDAIVAFDARAARQSGAIVAGREASGRPMATADAQIAAICASRGAGLATRDTGDFDDVGIDLINPW